MKTQKIIKFRVWDKKTNHFNTIGNLLFHFTEDKNYQFNGYNSKDFILQQFTNLKDKNNKEIYEGDIVSCHSWFDGMENKPRKKINILVELEFKTSITDENCGGYDGTQRYEDIEIIGNLFENPKLLNEKI